MQRKDILEQFGAGREEIKELLEYNQNIFSLQEGVLNFPCQDEPFVSCWNSYKQEALNSSVFEVLKDKLVQFHFPIKAGISRTDSYKTAVMKGQPVELITQATGLELTNPDSMTIEILALPAGGLPFLIINDRDDFIAIVRALIHRNEPVAIPDSFGSIMISGYNNWDRISSLRKEWVKKNPGGNWDEEFKRIIPEPELYKDKFVLISRGYYSAVNPRAVGLSEEEWDDISVKIRMGHEYTHYFTKKVLSSMRNNALDEILADFAGIVYATGEYKPDWFFTFMGLENYPDYRDGGRLQNYISSLPLSAASFKILQTLVKRAVSNIDEFTKKQPIQLKNNIFKVILTLSCFTLEELSSANALDILTAKYNDINSRWRNYI